MLTVAVLGLGARGGSIYSTFMDSRKDLYKVVAICDINSYKVNLFKEKFLIPDNMCFTSDEEFLSKGKLADCLLICTQDDDHYRHAKKAIELGYNILLEKPITPNADECIELSNLARDKGVKILVCHVLRYTCFYQQIKEVIDSGVLGQIISINQTENVAFWHQAHSFVRGSWRNKQESSPMILAKCCHDLDIMHWLVGSCCKTLSSVGKLSFFRKDKAPEGHAKICLECKKPKEECPYDAEKIYLKNFLLQSEEERKNNWLVNVLTNFNPTKENLIESLKNGQYGRCVFECDNDVVDYQNVSIEYENGVMGNLTMTAFSENCFRETRVRGTLGEIISDDLSKIIKVNIYGKDSYEIDINKIATDLSNHGGGDNKMMLELYDYLTDDNYYSKSLTTIEDSIESHLTALLAEKARISGKTYNLKKYFKIKD